VSTFGTSVNIWYKCQHLVRVSTFGKSVNIWYKCQHLVSNIDTHPRGL